MSKRTKEPVHKIFYICSKFIPDEDWSEFLKDCSFGKFPRGVRFENNTIKCTRKKQQFSESLPKDSEKALEVILTIFRDKLGIKTKREKKSASEVFERKRVLLNISDWKHIKKATVKQSIVRHFAERFAQENFLSYDEHRELIILLELGLSTKTIKPEHIIMEGGIIVEITILNFDYHTRRLSISGEPYSPARTTTRVPIYMKPVAQENYHEYFKIILEYHKNKLAVCK